MASPLTFISESRPARSAGDDDNTSTDSQGSTFSFSTPDNDDTTATSTNSSSLTSTGPTSTTNGTLTGITGASTTPRQHEDAVGTAVAVVITLVLIGAFLIFLYLYMKRKGKLDKLPCFQPMNKNRRSSTSSSRRALGDEHEVIENMQEPPRPREEGDDMFTIDDFEDNPDTQEGKEEYYYDEVFGQSQFEDEATNNAMRHLYTASETQPEEEMLDFDFETLGIKIDDYKIDPTRKNTI